MTRATGVILVTVNYRVGPLGFLTHPELRSESPHRVSGNYALLDAIAALKWVRSNIRAFGGDPDNVTIFGQSAGSLLVHYLMVSPPARGLFDAVIAQSNADLGPMRTAEGMPVLADAERAGVAFAKSLGVSSIAELRRVPAQTITASTFEGLPGVHRTNQSLPVIDGYLMPDEPYTLYAQGKQADVPLLLGYNEDEGAYFKTPIDRGKFAEFVHERYGGFAEQILSAFPAGSDKEATNSNNRLWEKAMYLGSTFSPGAVPDLSDHLLIDSYMRSLRSIRKER